MWFVPALFHALSQLREPAVDRSPIWKLKRCRTCIFSTANRQICSELEGPIAKAAFHAGFGQHSFFGLE